MARVATSDPYDKFRFRVTILQNIEMTFSSSTVSDAADSDLFNRAGFSEVSIPKANITEIKYRENVNGQGFIKKPGLVTYDPISLKRGSTASKDFFNWYRAVNNDGSTINVFTEALAGASFIPFQDPNFRRDLVISVIDREGRYTKHWVIFNAFPISHKGGNDLDSKSEDKLIEELVITYEGYVEVVASSVNEALNKVRNEGKVASGKALAAGAIGAFTGILGAR
jgi:phage tail-like protein